MSVTTVLVADDHPLFRRGLRDTLAAHPRFAVVAEAGDGAAAIDAIARLAPAIAILDLAMPGKDGLAVVDWAHRHAPATRTVIMTLYKERAFVDRAASLGASGYLVKDDAEAELLRCLDAIGDGEFYLSAAAAAPNPAPPAMPPDPALSSRMARLTAAQRLVLRHLADYRSSKEIARLLAISPKTVENHRANVAAALDLHGPNALLRFAVRHREEI